MRNYVYRVNIRIVLMVNLEIVINLLMRNNVGEKDL